MPIDVYDVASKQKGRGINWVDKYFGAWIKSSGAGIDHYKKPPTLYNESDLRDFFRFAEDKEAEEERSKMAKQKKRWLF
jgi:hypothetical protein